MLWKKVNEFLVFIISLTFPQKSEMYILEQKSKNKNKKRQHNKNLHQKKHTQKKTTHLKQEVLTLLFFSLDVLLFSICFTYSSLLVHSPPFPSLLFAFDLIPPPSPTQSLQISSWVCQIWGTGEFSNDGEWERLGMLSPGPFLTLSSWWQWLFPPAYGLWRQIFLLAFSPGVVMGFCYC